MPETPGVRSGGDEWSSVHRLLAAAADAFTHHRALNDDLLLECTVNQCNAARRPDTEFAALVFREARFQIATTIGIRPADRDDPLIGAAIDIVAKSVPEVQVRVLHKTIQRLPTSSPVL